MTGQSEVHPLPRSVAVRNGDVGVWHTAVAIRSDSGRPAGYVTLCQTPVPFDGTTQRDRQGIGSDGNGFGCGQCAEAEIRLRRES